MSDQTTTLRKTDSRFLESHSPVEEPICTVGSAGVNVTRLKQKAHQTVHRTGPEFVITNGTELNMQTAQLDAGFGKVPLLNRVGPTLIHPAHTDAEFMADGHHVVQVLLIEQAQASEMFHLDTALITRVVETVGYRQIADPTIFRATHDIWHQTNRAGSAAQLMVDGLLHIIMSRLLQHSELYKGQPSEAVLTQTQVARVIDVMEENLDQTITLQMLARSTGMSGSDFLAAFEETTGETPYRYLQSRRLLKVCELLASSDLSLEQIAKRCGFGSQAHLTTAFTKNVGHTPSVYRTDRKT